MTTEGIVDRLHQRHKYTPKVTRTYFGSNSSEKFSSNPATPGPDRAMPASRFFTSRRLTCGPTAFVAEFHHGIHIVRRPLSVQSVSVKEVDAVNQERDANVADGISKQRLFGGQSNQMDIKIAQHIRVKLSAWWRSPVRTTFITYPCVRIFVNIPLLFHFPCSVSL